jgi:hypothetical protein
MRAGIFLLLAALSGCGGSGSETPWPIEPTGPALGPSGETKPTSVVNETEDGEDPAKSEVAEQAKDPPSPRVEKDAGP